MNVRMLEVALAKNNSRSTPTKVMPKPERMSVLWEYLFLAFVSKLTPQRLASHGHKTPQQI
jgi:hypothetical protein